MVKITVGGVRYLSVDILVRKPPLISRGCETKGGFSYKRLGYTKTTEVPLGSTITWFDDAVRRKMVFSAPGEISAPQARKNLRSECPKCILAIGNRRLGVLILKIFAAARRLSIEIDYTTDKFLSKVT